jgi:hypothetical protein
MPQYDVNGKEDKLMSMLFLAFRFAINFISNILRYILYVIKYFLSLCILLLISFVSSTVYDTVQCSAVPMLLITAADRFMSAAVEHQDQ